MGTSELCDARTCVYCGQERSERRERDGIREEGERCSEEGWREMCLMKDQRGREMCLMNDGGMTDRICTKLKQSWFRSLGKQRSPTDREIYGGYKTHTMN